MAARILDTGQQPVDRRDGQVAGRDVAAAVIARDVEYLVQTDTPEVARRDQLVVVGEAPVEKGPDARPHALRIQCSPPLRCGAPVTAISGFRQRIVGLTAETT